MKISSVIICGQLVTSRTETLEEYFRNKLDLLTVIGITSPFAPYNVSRCSVYIHPARLEAFGASVVEAMATGLIPIVTEMTGAKDLVKQVDPSLIVPVNVDAISEINQTEEYKDFYVITIQITTKFAEIWEIQQVSPILNGILYNVYTELISELDKEYQGGSYSEQKFGS